MSSLFDLKGKVVVVTGGAGLLGRAFVESLASSGASVYLADVNDDHGGKVAHEMKDKGCRVEYVNLDITSEASVSGVIEDIVKKEGTIDGWVNNAYPRTADWGALFENIPFASWQKNVDGQLNGCFLCCQKVSEIMKEKKTGSIINVASTYGIVGPDFTVYDGTNMTMPAAYSAIKGGIINFTKYLASYLGKHNVRVNAVSPGGIFDNQPESFVKNYCKKVPLKRMGRPDDIAGSVVFLISDAARYVTGHNLVVDGGWTII